MHASYLRTTINPNLELAYTRYLDEEYKIIEDKEED